MLDLPKMYRKNALFAGLLIFLGIFAGILSIAPAVEGPNYLQISAENSGAILGGAFFQSLLVPIYFIFGLLMFPWVREYSHGLAVGMVTLRGISIGFQLVGVILLPLFIILSRSYLASSAENQDVFIALGDMLRKGRDLTNHMGVLLSIGLANLIMYYAFFRGSIIPRWLSVWGILGNLIALATSFLIFFGFFKVISTEFVVLSFPLVLQELIFAIWLVYHGVKKV